MNTLIATRPRPKLWAQQLAKAAERAARADDIVVEGSLSRMVGMTLEAVGCEVAVGGRCLIDTADDKQIEAEVVGFSGEKLFLMPTGDIRGMMPGARVWCRFAAPRKCRWETKCWAGFSTGRGARWTASANCAARIRCH
jgi:flagellum-specific ATP synthase